MKKRFLCIMLITIFTLGGCQNSSDGFLAYEDTLNATDHSIDNRVSQGEFFAEEIAVVAQYNNVGGDEQLNSGATLLINISESKAEYADHVFDQLYPSSLTKLLTALVVLKYGELTDAVSVSYNAAHIKDAGARVCGYVEGDVISMEALLNSLLIYSGNDAAIAIAEHVGGSVEGFVDMMNKEAAKIGAVQSNFMNPTGLHDKDQYTTAYDMYLVFNALLKYDTFRGIIGSSSYTVKYQNRNGDELEKVLNTINPFINSTDLLPEGITAGGGLTGSTSKAGNCCILLYKDGNNTEYIAVIMKAASGDSLQSQMSHLLSKTEAN